MGTKSFEPIKGRSGWKERLHKNATTPMSSLVGENRGTKTFHSARIPA